MNNWCNCGAFEIYETRTLEPCDSDWMRMVAEREMFDHLKVVTCDRGERILATSVEWSEGDDGHTYGFFTAHVIHENGRA